jgi:hypothetical protein
MLKPLPIVAILVLALASQVASNDTSSFFGFDVNAVHHEHSVKAGMDAFTEALEGPVDGEELNEDNEDNEDDEDDEDEDEDLSPPSPPPTSLAELMPSKHKERQIATDLLHPMATAVEPEKPVKPLKRTRVGDGRLPSTLSVLNSLEQEVSTRHKKAHNIHEDRQRLMRLFPGGKAYAAAAKKDSTMRHHRKKTRAATGHPPQVKEDSTGGKEADKAKTLSAKTPPGPAVKDSAPTKAQGTVVVKPAAKKTAVKPRPREKHKGTAAIKAFSRRFVPHHHHHVKMEDKVLAKVLGKKALAVHKKSRAATKNVVLKRKQAAATKKGYARYEKLMATRRGEHHRIQGKDLINHVMKKMHKDATKRKKILDTLHGVRPPEKKVNEAAGNLHGAINMLKGDMQHITGEQLLALAEAGNPNVPRAAVKAARFSKMASEQALVALHTSQHKASEADARRTFIQRVASLAARRAAAVSIALGYSAAAAHAAAKQAAKGAAKKASAAFSTAHGGAAAAPPMTQMVDARGDKEDEAHDRMAFRGEVPGPDPSAMQMNQVSTQAPKSTSEKVSSILHSLDTIEEKQRSGDTEVASRADIAERNDALEELNEEAMQWLERRTSIDEDQLASLSDGMALDERNARAAVKREARKIAAKEARIAQINHVPKKKHTGHSFSSTNMIAMARELGARREARRAMLLARLQGEGYHGQLVAVKKAVRASLKGYASYGHSPEPIIKQVVSEMEVSMRASENRRRKIAREAYTKRFCALPWFRKLAYSNGDLCGDLRKKYAKKGRIVRFKNRRSATQGTLVKQKDGGTVMEYIPKAKHNKIATKSKPTATAAATEKKRSVDLSKETTKWARKVWRHGEGSRFENAPMGPATAN